jgi:hypothetical protein
MLRWIAAGCVVAVTCAAIASAQQASSVDVLLSRQGLKVKDIEIRGTVHWDTLPMSIGATAVRISPPDRFLIVERTPGSAAATHVAALNDGEYWAARDGQPTPSHDVAKRRLLSRFNHYIAVYLRTSPKFCSAIIGEKDALTTIRFAGGDCSPFTIAFGDGHVVALEYQATILSAGAPRPEPGDPRDSGGTLQREARAILRTEFEATESFGGLSIPSVAKTMGPGNRITWRVTDVRVNRGLTAKDFASTADLREIMQWVNSVSR